MNTSGSSKHVRPTLLAFHGSGSNASIHMIQMARVNRLIREHFEIISLEAPFPSAAGPGILPFFEGCGPYKRWTSPSEKISATAMREGRASGVMTEEVENLIKSTVRDIRAKGGKVVGLIGFSQGTRIIAGLIKAVEIKKKLVQDAAKDNVADSSLDWLDFDFALSVCTSYPPFILPVSVADSLKQSALPSDRQTALLNEKIKVPTLHILGMTDEWHWAGEMLIKGCFEVGEGKSKVLELNDGHMYPRAQEDTQSVADWLLDTYERVTVAKA